MFLAEYDVLLSLDEAEGGEALDLLALQRRLEAEVEVGERPFGNPVRRRPRAGKLAHCATGVTRPCAHPATFRLASHVRGVGTSLRNAHPAHEMRAVV
jgi:hypothetical protein